MTVDRIQLEIAIKHDKARQEIADITERLQGETKQLKELDQAKRKAMKKYKDESHPEVVKATQAYEEQTKKIDALRSRKDELRRSLKVEGLSIAEVRDELKKYNMQLANLTPGTEKFNETKRHVDELKERLKELNSTAESLGKFGGGGFFKNLFGAKFDFGGIKTFLTGNVLFKAGEMIFDTVAEYAGRAFERVKSLVVESVQAARAAEGITHAFKQMDQPGLLDNLRRATHGTVSDLELMKAAVQAQDFRLPLDQLGKYLEFAQLKAQQTGQSVEYMTSSIVTGLGRKSLHILDNLGLSAAEVKEEMEKTGDMATAVGNIIDRQIADAGEHFEDAAEREARATTDVTNAQLELGQQMKATFGIGNTSLSEMQSKAEAFILKGLTKMIIFCQDLYNRLASVRLVVEAVKVAFDTVFKVCEVGFLWLIDTVKGVARLFRDLGGLIESVFTRDWDNVKAASQRLLQGIGKSIREFVDDGKDVGKRWGNNVMDSIDATMGKRKVKAPEMDVPKRKILPVVPEDNKPTKTGKTNSLTSTKESSATTDDEYRRLLADREKAYREYGNSLRQMRLNNLLSEKEYQEESYEAELKFLSDKAELQQQYGQDVTDTQRQYLDKMLQEATRRHQQQQEQLRKQQEQERRELERNRLSQEGNNDYLQKVEWQGQTFDRMRQLNEEYLQQNLISYQQYQDNLTRIAQEQEAQRQQLQQAAIDATQQLLSSASSFFSAMQQRETAQVDAKYKRLINAAKKQGKDTTRLEEQQEQEKAAIAKKYADRNFKIQVLQIIANTAQGISKTIAELGMPWAVPFVAMAAAAGAMQLAAAKASAEQAAGLYSGGYSDDYQEGYTRRGDPRRQAGFIPVHQNEFVANHHAVANPHLRPVLDVIDRHQRLGDIQMLNATRLLDEAYGRGRYQGGYTRPFSSTAPAAVSDASPSETADRLLPILTRIEQNTASSLTVRRLRDEIAHEERLEQNARR